MDTAARMKLLKQAQGVMYAEQPMIVIDYPSVLQAVNVERWEGWQPYAGGSVWNNFLSRQSYIELKPKVAAAASVEGGSDAMRYVVGILVALGGAAIVVALKRRSDGRAVEE
jgi:hypothetical protein